MESQGFGVLGVSRCCCCLGLPEFEAEVCTTCYLEYLESTDGETDEAASYVKGRYPCSNEIRSLVGLLHNQVPDGWRAVSPKARGEDLIRSSHSIDLINSIS